MARPSTRSFRPVGIREEANYGLSAITKYPNGRVYRITIVGGGGGGYITTSGDNIYQLGEAGSRGSEAVYTAWLDYADIYNMVRGSGGDASPGGGDNGSASRIQDTGSTNLYSVAGGAGGDTTSLSAGHNVPNTAIFVDGSTAGQGGYGSLAIVDGSTGATDGINGKILLTPLTP